MNIIRKLFGFRKSVGDKKEENDRCAASIVDNSSIENRITEVVSNLPGKDEFDKNDDLNTYDVDGLLAALRSSDRARKLIAIEKLEWSLYGKESHRVEVALAKALHDKDKYVAIRSAKTFLMEGQGSYKKHVVEASEDLSVNEGTRQSFKAMIYYMDNNL